LKVRVYYNPHKGVFVAKRSDDTVVKVSSDFGEVDTAAHIETSFVEYDIESFPKNIREKIDGEHSRTKEYESFKSLFMKLLFSYGDLVPSDDATRAVIRKMLKRKLSLVKVVTVNNHIYIITHNKDFVVFRLREVKGSWRIKEIRNLKLLPESVLKQVGEVIE